MTDNSNIYLWFDTEFTHLDVEPAELLQVALIATGPDLQRLLPPEEDLNLLVRLDPSHKASDWVEANLQEMLTKCRSADALSVFDVDAKLAEYVDRLSGKPTSTIKTRPCLAGNSVYADMIMARKFLPEFERRIHYRLLDVSSLKILWEAKGSEEFDKENAGVIKQWLPFEASLEGKPHDAYYDILASVAELNFYQQNMLASSKDISNHH